jgi:hypothetical protein
MYPRISLAKPTCADMPISVLSRPFPSFPVLSRPFPSFKRKLNAILKSSQFLDGKFLVKNSTDDVNQLS